MRLELQQRGDKVSGWFLGCTGTWYSGQERAAMARKTKAARRQGKIINTGVCNRCGQDQGKVSHHNHDYCDPIKYLEELCWMCHQVVHAEVYAPKACEKYWQWIGEGNKSIPFSTDTMNQVWAVMRTRFKIFRPKGYGKITPPQEVLDKYGPDGFRIEGVSDEQFTLF